MHKTLGNKGLSRDATAAEHSEKTRDAECGRFRNTNHNDAELVSERDDGDGGDEIARR